MGRGRDGMNAGRIHRGSGAGPDAISGPGSSGKLYNFQVFVPLLRALMLARIPIVSRCADIDGHVVNDVGGRTVWSSL
jgi:hypothetical protein